MTRCVTLKLEMTQPCMIYIITSPIHEKDQTYKIGRHTGSLKELLKRYMTPIPNAVVRFNHSTANPVEHERVILNLVGNFRILTAEGRKTEWVKMPLSDLIRTILTYFERKEPSSDHEARAKPVTNEPVPLGTPRRCSNTMPGLQYKVSIDQTIQNDPLNPSPLRKGRTIIQMSPRWVFVEEFPSISAAIKKTESSRYQIMKALNRQGNFDGTEDFFWLDKVVYDDLRQKHKGNSHDKGLSSLQNQITSGMLNLAAQLICDCYGEWNLNKDEIPTSPEFLNQDRGLLSGFKQRSFHAVPIDKYFIYDYLENKFAQYGTTKEPASTVLDSNQLARAQSLFIEALMVGKDRFQSVETFESFIERFTQHTTSDILSMPITRNSTDVTNPRSSNTESGTTTGTDSSSLVQLTKNWEYIQKFPSIVIASVVTGISIDQINCVLNGDVEEKSALCLWMREQVYNLLERDEEVRPILQFEILPTLHSQGKLLAEYPSVAAGSRLTGVAIDAIKRSLNDRKVCTDNFIWRDKMLKVQPEIEVDPPEPLRNTPSNPTILISPSVLNQNTNLSNQVPRPDEPRTSELKTPEPNSPVTEGSKPNHLRIRTEFTNLFDEVERRLRRYDYETRMIDRASLTELENITIKIRVQFHFLKSKGEGTVESYHHRIADFESKILRIGKGVDEYERLEASFKSLDLEDQETPVRRGPEGDLYKPSLLKIWDAHIGVNVGRIKCPYCKVNFINPFHFQTGHVIAKSAGGKDIVENLRPICSLCNQSMGANSMDLSKYRVEYPQRNLFI